MHPNENRKRPIDLPIEKDEGVRVLGHRDGRGKHVCLPGGGFIPHRLFFDAFYDVDDGDTVRRGPVEIRVRATKTGRKDRYDEHVYDVTMHVTIKMSNCRFSKHTFVPEVCREILQRLNQLKPIMSRYAIPKKQPKRAPAPPKPHKGNGISNGAAAA